MNIQTDNTTIASTTYQDHEEEVLHMTREQAIDNILEYFKNNTDTFNECIEQLDSYDGYLGDDRYYDMNDLPELLSGYDPLELLNRAYFGNDEDDCIVDKYNEKHYMSFNPNRDYFRFNGYGNLSSTNYKDYSDHLDAYAVEAMDKNRHYIDAIDENSDLSDLFDVYEEAE